MRRALRLLVVLALTPVTAHAATTSPAAVTVVQTRLALGHGGAGVVAGMRQGGTDERSGLLVQALVVRVRRADGSLGAPRTMTSRHVEVGGLTAAANAAGQGIVAWTQYDGVTDRIALYALRCTPSGCGAPVLVNARQSTLRGAALRAVVAPDGRATVLFASHLGAHRLLVEAVADVPATGAAGAPRILATGGAGGPDALAVDARGALLAAWAARAGSRKPGFTVARRAAGANRFATPPHRFSRAPTSGVAAAASGTGDGLVIVATQTQTRTGAGDVMVGSSAHGPLFIVGAAGANPVDPAIVGLGAATLAAWALPDARVMAQLGPHTAVPVATGAVTRWPLELAALSGGRAALAWTGAAGPTSEVACLVVGADGVPGPVATIADGRRLTDMSATGAAPVLGLAGGTEPEAAVGCA